MRINLTAVMFHLGLLTAGLITGNVLWILVSMALLLLGSLI